MSLSRHGSPAALSIASSKSESSAIAAVVMTGSLAAITAAKLIYHKYESYEEKKHKKKINIINKLYRKYLSNIKIPELNEKIQLPQIFQINNETTEIESMHFTDEQIELMDNMPASKRGDPDLMAYQDLILCTIRKLQQYYLMRKTKDDVTAGVLSWLLYILESYCLNFQGYEIDIACLKAIESFLSEFASIKKTKKSRNFSWLAPADRYLIDAIELLQDHKATNSLKESISELSGICLTQSDELIRMFIKLLIDNKNYNTANFVTMHEVEKKTLQKKRIHTTLFGCVIKNQEEIVLDSFFSYWAEILAGYYLYSIDLPVQLSANPFEPPEELFNLPIDINKIKEAFNIGSNFITRKSKKRSLIKISDKNELLDRAEFLQQIAALIHKIISLQYLCNNLLKSFQQLGSIYIENPLHLQRYFSIINSLCKKIIINSRRIKTMIKRYFSKINQEHTLNSFRLLPNQLAENVTFIDKKLDDLSETIRRQKNLAHKQTKSFEEQKLQVTHRMFDIASKIEKIYDIQQDYNFVEPYHSSENTIELIHHEEHYSFNDHDDEEFKSFEAELSINQEVNLNLRDMYSRIFTLENQGASNECVSSYLKIYNALMELFMHLSSVANNEQRANSILLLTLSFSIQMNNFLNMNADSRYASSGILATSIQRESRKIKNKVFIDQHQQSLSRWIYKLFSCCSFFQTSTRKNINKLDKALNDLVIAESEDDIQKSL